MCNPAFPYAGHMAALPSNPIFDLLPRLSEPGFISFAAGVPSPAAFPREDLHRLVAQLMEEDGFAPDAPSLWQYGSTEGYPLLRESAQVLFSRAGIDMTAALSSNRIFITTGGQQAIDLFCRLMIEPGDPVLVETPTYSATLQILSVYQANPIGIPSDEDGILPDALEELIRKHRPKFIYLIPNFQNPSGRTLNLERRRRVAHLAAQYGVMVIEDDPYRELRYFGEHLPSIKSCAQQDCCDSGHVIYMTSVSKILCPGLRVGACLLPDDLFDHMIVAKQTADMHSAILPQAIADKYLRAGLLDGHLAVVLPLYRERLSAMKQAAARYFPQEAVFTDPQGGLFLFCTLPPQVDTASLLPAAVDRKIAFIPGEQFYAGERVTNTMRLNFSNETPEVIDRGMKALGTLLKEVL